MEKEYQAVIKGNKSSRKYESRSNWRNGRLDPEEEQKRNQRENVYRQLVYRLRERLGERYPLNRMIVLEALVLMWACSVR